MWHQEGGQCRYHMQPSPAHPGAAALLEQQYPDRCQLFRQLQDIATVAAALWPPCCLAASGDLPVYQAIIMRGVLQLPLLHCQLSGRRGAARKSQPISQMMTLERAERSTWNMQRSVRGCLPYKRHTRLCIH